LNKNKGVSIKGRPSTSKPDGIPGPGAYATHSKLTDKKGASFSIAGKPSPKKVDKSPEPGTYSPNFKAVI